MPTSWRNSAIQRRVRMTSLEDEPSGSRLSRDRPPPECRHSATSTRAAGRTVGPVQRTEHLMRFVILSEAKDPRHPGREPSIGTTKILRLTPQDDASRYPSLNTIAGSIRVARNP